jgi:hypothetical protein
MTLIPAGVHCRKAIDVDSWIQFAGGNLPW